MTHPLISDVLADMEAEPGFGKPEPDRWVVTIYRRVDSGATEATTHRCTQKRSMDAVELVLARLGIDTEDHGEIWFLVRRA